MSPPPVGGLTLSDELRALSEQPGFLASFRGGQRMRDLYQQESAKFEFRELCPFGRACFLGQTDVMKWLIERGDAPDIESYTTAYKWSWIMLVVHGSQRLRPVPSVEREPGVKYAEQEHVQHADALRYLISVGALLNLQDIAGYTALHHATITMSVPHMARILLEAGADPNIPDKYGSPPIFGASLSRQIEAIDVLMEYGARIDVSDADDFCLEEKYVGYGPEVAAAIYKWIRKREGREAPLEGNACDYCGKPAGGDVKLSYCSRCKLARYHTKECQTNHWKIHKLTCKAPDMENTITLKPYYDSPMTLFKLADLANERMGVNTQTAKEMLEGKNKSNKVIDRKLIEPEDKEASRMVIKVQVPLMIRDPTMSGDCLVYSKRKDFLCVIKKDDNEENYAKLVQVVRSKGISGLKAYFRAELKSRDELEIRIDDVLAEQAF
ncbi:hypothetical protein FRC02_011949 [Tulasnella sp. 418]|nr:hypothetical protein FRC02_011949 [Tulasnella sp. 418]